VQFDAQTSHCRTWIGRAFHANNWFATGADGLSISKYNRTACGLIVTGNELTDRQINGLNSRHGNLPSGHFLPPLMMNEKLN
jgi:hypothetical protein